MSAVRTSGTSGSMVTDGDERQIERRAKRAVSLVVGGLVLAAVLGSVMAWMFVSAEKERNLHQWQVRMNIVADSRAAEVSRWIDDRVATLRILAHNASLQLYMTNLTMGIGADAVEGQYLRTLMEATAQRDGFAMAMVSQINANVAPSGVAGMALVDTSGRVLISTVGMPALPAEMISAMERAGRGQFGLMDARLNQAGVPVIGFAVPIYGVQDDPGAGRQIGFVIGLRPLNRDLFDRLVQPGDTAASAENYLIRNVGNEIEYLSPLADGTDPLKRRMATDTPKLADAFALESPGSFDLRRGYAGTDVLVTGRAITSTPWTLVRKVDAKEALDEAESRLRIMLVVLLVAIGAMIAGAFALWRHGTSVRLSQVAMRYKTTAERFESLIQFMRVVTDSQPTHIMCCNAEGLITFANRPLARDYGIPISDIKNKPMTAVLGPVKAKLIGDINKRVIESGQNAGHLFRWEEPEGLRVVATDHVYVPPAAKKPAAALTVFHDITELTRERDRSEARLNQLVAALVGVVDRRDPYSAHHSARVSEVARAIGVEMELSEKSVRTVELAGRLMNVGKIVIPPELLTKTGDLTDPERQLLLRSFVISAELLADVEFDAPVVDTISQIGECVDGSGPLGLKAESILMTAQIVAVANSFVGMVSPRSWRGAMEFEAASEALHKQIDSKFDRRPISALVNVIDNRDGARRWAHFREKPRA